MRSWCCWLLLWLYRRGNWGCWIIAWSHWWSNWGIWSTRIISLIVNYYFSIWSIWSSFPSVSRVRNLVLDIVRVSNYSTWVWNLVTLWYVDNVWYIWCNDSYRNSCGTLSTVWVSLVFDLKHYQLL